MFGKSNIFVAISKADYYFSNKISSFIKGISRFSKNV